MRFLDENAKQAVQQVIEAHIDQLREVPGFVAAEPGFYIANGTVQREPAIVVFVMHKRPPADILEEERAPRQLGPYRVAVMQADPLKQVESLAEQADVATSLSAAAASQLTYKRLPGNPIDTPFKVKEPMLCHAGPDAGWPVLKPFIEATKETLTVAMYDFNADYIAKTFIDTVRANDIKAVLTWDNGMTADETVIRGKLKKSLKQNLDGWLVQCGAGYRFANSYHEKVAVRDSSAFWLSSGNWSKRSQPNIDPIGDPPSAKGMYGKGNREWHVIVDDKPLAELFEKYIFYDRDGSREEAEAGDDGAALAHSEVALMPDVFVPIADVMDAAALAAPPEPFPPEILPSAPRDVTVLPVLTPDNYLDRLLELLKSATRSIYLQFAYINYSDKAQDKRFTDMLALLGDLTYRPGLDVKIIMGSNSAAAKILKLTEAGFKETAFRTQSNIHNKGIIVDGKAVLVSSTNWSADGVLRNRDAGVIIHDEEIAGYYQKIFLYDWEQRASSTLSDDPPVMVAAPGDGTPPGMVRMSWVDYHG